MRKHLGSWVAAPVLVWCLACLDEVEVSNPLVGPDTLAGESNEPIWISVPDLSFDGVRVRFFGPIEYTLFLSSDGTNWNATAPSLRNGTYDVVVMGLVGGDVDHCGLARDVVVSENRLPPISISFETFRPTMHDLTVTPNQGVTVVFCTVAHATKYMVEHDDEPAFAAATSVETADTSLTCSVPEFGMRYVRVRAGNQYVPMGRAGEVDSVEVSNANAKGEAIGPEDNPGSTGRSGSH